MRILVATKNNVFNKCDVCEVIATSNCLICVVASCVLSDDGGMGTGEKWVQLMSLLLFEISLYGHFVNFPTR